MNWLDWLVIILLSLAFIGAILYLFLHRGSCGDCAHCEMNCTKKKRKKDNNQKRK